ncbi:MAG: single-stranded-DNA-specific exonuclease RecJ [Anaerolineae bacterium]|nr:single-stranded-DNA-specific exonuclease RecJ [Anaerolineae bacterium]
MPTAQRWFLRRRRPPKDFLSRFPELDPVLARVLYARKIDTPAKVYAFLAGKGELANPFSMAGMNQAVARLRQALRRGEHIVVYGDFDVDGISATALLVSALRLMGAHVSPYIPDRFTESYGLNKEALKRLRQEGAQVVVTVDCGIRSVEEVRYARSLGLEMIITDHHTVPEELPPALAVIDPKRPDCPYPFKELSGVGVAYRLAEALFRVQSRMGDLKGEEAAPAQFEDLVALGTVADIVPLVGENRLLAIRGLRKLRENPRVGLYALMKVAGLDPEQVDSRAISFRLGPRLNAAGRLEHAKLAYSLLMTSSPKEAEHLAAELQRVNQQRQALLERQVEEARALLGEEGDRLVLIVDGPNFHEGVVGLVASRLAEEFYRPALVMHRGEEMTRGSARSIEGFHITHALDACADLLLRYGGHAQAAGFTLPTSSLRAFRERLENYCEENLDEETLLRRYSVDAIVSLEELHLATPAALAQMEPFGAGNPEPLLAALALRLVRVRAVGQEGAHLQLQFADGQRVVKGIAFRQGELAGELRPGELVDVLFRPAVDEWNGQKRLQLYVEAIRKAKIEKEENGDGE